MQTIKMHCLIKAGQERKTDSTTHLPWTTIPMKLICRKGTMAKELENCFELL